MGRINTPVRWKSGVISLPKVDRDDEKQVQLFKDIQPKIQEFMHILFDKFVYQLELGQTKNNYHYQCLVYCKEKDRVDQYDMPEDLTLHCKPISNEGKQALKNYCMKKDKTYIAGPWGDKPIIEDLTCKQEEFMKNNLPPLPPWASYALGKIPKHQDHRKILWYVDTVGETGKSCLAVHLQIVHKALYLVFADARSLLSIAGTFFLKNPVTSHFKNIVIVNFTKSKPKDVSMCDIYSALESIKDGNFVMTKGMDMRQVLVPKPIVVVFANFTPDMSGMAKNRFELELIY